MRTVVYGHLEGVTVSFGASVELWRWLHQAWDGTLAALDIYDVDVDSLATGDAGGVLVVWHELAPE